MAIVKRIIHKYPYTFYAFGSRVKGTARPLSDLDLCYKEDIPDSEIAQLRDDFEESNLPFKVDIVSWKRCSDEFKASIASDLVLLSTAWTNQL